MKIENIIKDFNVDFTLNVVSKNDLFNYSNILNVDFGPQTEEYLLTYGYLGYESIEFYGVNSNQGEMSDMISQTLYLNKYFPLTRGYIAFENISEGIYALVSSEDMIYIFNSEMNSIIAKNCDLFVYIRDRLNEGF